MAPRARAWRPITQLSVRVQHDGAWAGVGALASDRSGRIYFQYDPAWVTRGVELSPFGLPTNGPFGAIPAPHPTRRYGLHGLFADSLPDQWGLRLQDRALRRLGFGLTTIGPLDRLAFLGARTMGALTYEPSFGHDRAEDRETSLDALLGEVDALLAGSAPADGVTHDDLELAAGSAGGAQPKATVAITADGRLLTGGHGVLSSGSRAWLVKFTPARFELGLRADAGVVEEAYARMARAAGIEVPSTRLLATADGRLHFAVERFDRTATGERRHVQTLGGLLDRDAADDTDYAECFRVAIGLAQDQRAVDAVWRRACFNLLAVNDDDHCRNIAFRLDPSVGWHLAPAYDLTFSPARGGQRGMSVAGYGREVTRSVAIECAVQGGVSRRHAAAIYDEVRAALLQWTEHAEAAGVSDAATRELGEAMRERRAWLERE